MGGRRRDVGDVEGDGGNEKGCGEPQEREERKRLVFPSHSFRSSTVQCLLQAFLFCFVSEERGGDELGGGCCVEGSPESEGGCSQKVVCVATVVLAVATGELVVSIRQH
jgi:hypothetical protein